MDDKDFKILIKEYEKLNEKDPKIYPAQEQIMVFMG